MRAVLSVILFLLFAISCNHKKSSQTLESIVTEWKGKQIVFPDNPVFTHYASDTADYSIPQSQYKVLLYIDSFGCSGCMLQGEMWKSFIEFIDSATNKSVPFLFFFNPKRDNDLSDLLHSVELNIPVCLDTNDELNGINKFPANNMLRAFLLDGDNKVLLIGNPIYNETMEKLYIETITGKKYNSISPIPTEAMLNVTEIDAGSLHGNQTAEISFQLRNTGKRPLYIYSLQTSCDFIDIEFDNRPIQPNSYEVLIAKITPRDTGQFCENIILQYNTKEPITLKLYGWIID